jgi:hypothetical protein
MNCCRSNRNAFAISGVLRGPFVAVDGGALVRDGLTLRAALVVAFCAKPLPNRGQPQWRGRSRAHSPTI